MTFARAARRASSVRRHSRGAAESAPPPRVWRRALEGTPAASPPRRPPRRARPEHDPRTSTRTWTTAARAGDGDGDGSIGDTAPSLQVLSVARVNTPRPVLLARERVATWSLRPGASGALGVSPEEKPEDRGESETLGSAPSPRERSSVLFDDDVIDEALDSFKTLFCARCHVYDCVLHGCGQIDRAARAYEPAVAERGARPPEGAQV